MFDLDLSNCFLTDGRLIIPKTVESELASSLLIDPQAYLESLEIFQNECENMLVRV